jgi:2-dehydropantoate 2-reductase
MARVAVVGVGAIGATVAAALQRAGGHDVVLCARRDPGGVVVEQPDGERVTLAAPVVVDPAAVSPVDWVLLAVKAHQTEGAAGWLRALCVADTTVAVLQNGIDHVERVAPLAGAATVLPTVNWCPVEPADGGFRQRGPLRLMVPAGAQGLGELFGVEAEVEVRDDFASAAWKKLCANAVAGILAVTERRTEVLLEPDVRALAETMAVECAAVARAEGASLSDDRALEVVAGLAAMPADSSTSILADREAGRPLEWEARNAAVGSIARRHGIATPTCDALAALLHAVSA